MKDLALQFLVACDESIKCRLPLLVELASFLHVAPSDVYYLWAEKRCKQHGDLPHGEWKYFFHGYECDIENTKDARFLRVDFGPDGITWAFTAWGVAQFIMTAKEPWPEFPELKSHLVDSAPPHDQNSASSERAGRLCDQLDEQGLIAVARPDLVEFAKRHRSVNAQGISILRLPDTTSERTWAEINVAERRIVSDKGKSLLLALSEGNAGTEGKGGLEGENKGVSVH